MSSSTSVNSSEIIQLSRGFQTTPAQKEMPKGELIGKSIVAASLGIVPFLTNQVSMYIFKGIAYTGSLAEKKELSGTPIMKKVGFAAKILTGIPGIFAAATMLGSAKLFSLSQLPPWQHYVKNPSGDGTNTRLAWYGAQNRISKDLTNIVKAFFLPAVSQQEQKLWTLSDWSKLKV